MRRDELYVLDIIESADLIINWLAGMSVDAWDADEKTRAPAPDHDRRGRAAAWRVACCACRAAAARSG
jgi:hypothetical protein